MGCLTFSDPLAVFQVALKNHYLPIGLLMGAGMVLAIAFLLGTVFCSWICPFGLLSELVNSFSSRVWPKKFRNRKIVFKANNCVSHAAPFPCHHACSLNLDPKGMDGWNLTQCTNCGDCVDACANTGKALVYKLSSPGFMVKNR